MIYETPRYPRTFPLSVLRPAPQSPHYWLVVTRQILKVTIGGKADSQLCGGKVSTSAETSRDILKHQEPSPHPHHVHSHTIEHCTYLT